tara:strand:- start:78 stop:341 length:264 start_codon:yes stop_codon:yes gene_type:complete
MSGYTPATENVRNCYVYAYEQHDGSLLKPERQQRAEFDRWLAVVKAEAWDEGHKEGWESRHDDATAGFMPSGVHQSDAKNPYREVFQ